MRFKILWILSGVIILAACTRIDDLRFGDKRPTTVVDSRMSVSTPGAMLQKSGDIMSVYRQGSTPSSLDGVILKTLSTDGGKSWAQPDTIVSTSWDCRTPSITQLRDGLIIVTFTQSRNDLRAGAILPVGCFTARSFDSGQTFTAPRMISIPEFYWTATSDELLELDDGTLLLPFYGQRIDSAAVATFATRSTDSGESWENPVPVTEDSAGQKAFEHPTFLQLPDGRILCVADSPGSEGYLVQSESADGGLTWSVPRSTTIHGHHPDMMLTPHGAVVCAYGDHWPSGISQMTSYDWGATWEQEESLVDLGATLFWPAIISAGPDRMLALYDVRTDKGESSIHGLIMKSSPPSAPVGFSASYQSGSGVHLRWNQVDGASYYLVHRHIIADFAPSPGFPFEGSGIASPTLNIYVDAAVDTGQTYYYRVAAVRGKGKLLEGTGSLGQPTDAIQVNVH